MRYLLLVLGLVAASGAGAQTEPVLSAFDFSGLEVRYWVGDTVEFTAVNAVPLVVSLCGSVIQREADGGLWADADTLQCSEPPPDEMRHPDAGRARLRVTLKPGVFHDVLASVGPGWFRVVLGATDGDRRPLPEAVRASPAFLVDGPARVDAARAEPVGLGRLSDEARALYGTLTGFRAIAVGTRPDGQTVWGYSFRSRSANHAAYRALSECASRAGRASAPCVLAAIDGPAPDEPRPSDGE